jgi:hypothetical protein
VSTELTVQACLAASSTSDPATPFYTLALSVIPPPPPVALSVTPTATLTINPTTYCAGLPCMPASRLPPLPPPPPPPAAAQCCCPQQHPAAAAWGQGTTPHTPPHPPAATHTRSGRWQPPTHVGCRRHCQMQATGHLQAKQSNAQHWRCAFSGCCVLKDSRQTLPRQCAGSHRWC